MAKRSKSFLNLNKAASGLLSLSTLSHLAPPTAPNNTASQSIATCIVSSLIELPSLSYAVPPTNLSEISKDKDLVFSIQSIIFNTSAITSLPIPSPGKIKIFLLLIFD